MNSSSAKLKMNTHQTHTRISLFAALALMLAVDPLPAQTRTASTPEDRSKAVRLTRALEADPLNSDAKEHRNWLVRWLIDVPDITVTLCGNLLGPLLASKKNYSAEIFTQMGPSSAAFIIEHPDQANDRVAVLAAGLDGALKTYESILKAKPKARWPFLDDLIQKRAQGQLIEHVRQTNCK